MKAQLRFEVVSDDATFDALRPEWESLLERSPTRTLFNTWAWLRCWWEHYGAGRRLAIVVAREGAVARGILPLMVERERWKRLVPFRTLRLLGDGSFDSDYLDFLIPVSDGPRVVEDFWRFLFSEPGLRFDLVRICEMPTTSPHYGVLRSLLDTSGARVREQRMGAVFTRLPSNWDAYVASLKPRMRTKVRSLKRHLEEEHTVGIRRASTPEEINAALTSLFELHELRWKGRGQRGVFADPRKRAFYREMSHRFGDRGWLRLHTLDVDGCPVAHQHCVAHEGVLYLLQEGYDPAWEDHGVGNILRSLVLEESVREGLHTYDFLGGVTQHKLSWAGEVKESTRFTCLGKGHWGLLYFELSSLGASVRRLRARVASKDRPAPPERGDRGPISSSEPRDPA